MIEVLQYEQYKPLCNYKNYYDYSSYIEKNQTQMQIEVSSLSISNIDDHISGIYNILKDGIETDYVKNTKIKVIWNESLWCNLTVIDYWYNLFMWSMVLKLNNPITPNMIFYDETLKKKDIKLFIDRFIMTKENKVRYGKNLNKIIADGTWYFSYIESFALYCANTINNEDDIDLMNHSKEFFDLMHLSLDGISYEDVKTYGQDIADKAINIIKDSGSIMGYEHGLANSFKAKEGINNRQYKESKFNIGTKAIDSTAIPVVIKNSFSNGGVNTPETYITESSSARDAQIKSKDNVGDTGDFARILNLNNIDTIFHPEFDYSCLTKHYVKFEIKSKKHLTAIKNRNAKLNPRGIQFNINPDDNDLIGRTVYLRSPMTCASHSDGLGICSTCYGDLYYINLDINPGVIAAEYLSSKITQKLLSAKHLTETDIIKILWSEHFEKFFNVDINVISLLPDLQERIPDLKKYSLLINPEDIVLVNDEEDTIKFDDDMESVNLYNEYITSFIIKTPIGETFVINSSTNSPIYLSTDLNNTIRNKAINDDGFISVGLDKLIDKDIFYIKVSNNAITKALYDIINIINKSDVTDNLNKDQALQNIMDLIIDNGLDIDSIHIEVMLSNQIVDKNNILKKPDWKNHTVEYDLLTLNRSLSNNPSVIISWLYKDLGRVLYHPLTFEKNAPSFLDLFFMEKPQEYMEEGLLTTMQESGIRDSDKSIEMCTVVKKEMCKIIN